MVCKATVMPFPARRGRGAWWANRPRIVVAIVVAVFLALWAFTAFAQVAQPNDCSQSVGASAAAVPFPASGKTGPSLPTSSLDICNAHATQTLGLNWVGGTAAIGSQGTLTLSPGGCKTFPPSLGGTLPGSVSVIGSGAATVTACAYR